MTNNTSLNDVPASQTYQNKKRFLGLRDYIFFTKKKILMSILFGDSIFELRKFICFIRIPFVQRLATKEAQDRAALWNAPVRTEVIASPKTPGVIALPVGLEKYVLTPALLTFYGVTIALLDVHIASTEVSVIASVDPASANPGSLANFVRRNVKLVSGVMDVLMLVIVHLM